MQVSRPIGGPNVIFVSTVVVVGGVVAGHVDSNGFRVQLIITYLYVQLSRL